MRFLSIFTHEGRNTPPTAEEMASMGRIIEEGMKSGWLIATEGVLGGVAPVRVQSVGGNITVTDGPFAEAKEVLGGYALMQASSRDHAVELARQFLKVAGDGSCEIYGLYEPPPPPSKP